MKNSILFCAILCVGLCACQTIGECDNISATQVIFLLDVSDEKLYAEIQKDIKSNLPSFMARTRLANTKECEQFRLGMAHLSGKDDLDIESASIGIKKRNQSNKVARSQSHPGPVIALVKDKLKEFEDYAQNPDFTSGSFIANQLVKSLLEADEEGENLIFVFSDMVENHKALPMYKKIPKQDEVVDYIPKIIDEKLLRAFQEKQEMGVDAQVYLVLKNEPSGKIEERKVRAFWTELLTQLNIDFQIIDNLSVHLDR